MSYAIIPNGTIKKGDPFVWIDVPTDVNGEFYTCPVYNYCIAKQMKIGIFNIPFSAMYGLGTPEDLQKFIQRYNEWR